MTTPPKGSLGEDLVVAAMIAEEYAALTSRGPTEETPLSARLKQWARLAPEMVSMLKELAEGDAGECCMCGRGYMETARHAPDCRLAALLRELP